MAGRGGGVEEGRAAGVCGRTPGATVWKVLPSAGAKSALCVHSPSPHRRASQLRAVLQARGLTPRVRPESLLWQEARGAPAASHNGISSRPCPGEPPAPLPNCQPRGERRLCGSPGQGRGHAADIAGHAAPDMCLWALGQGPGDSWVLQGSAPRKG